MEDYKKLNNQPLKFVLAEFRFSTVYEIEGYIPSIQEGLRKSYPRDGKSVQQSLQIQRDTVEVTTNHRWDFVSANKKSAVQISQDRVVFITAEYDRFEGFSRNCRQAIKKIEEIVEPSLILRIGLRYSDLIILDEGVNLSDLVDEKFGVANQVDTLGAIRQHTTDTFVVTDMGGLAIRSLYGWNNLICLPDIRQLPIQIDADEEASERIILDFDHHWDANNESIAFNYTNALEKLNLLHETTRAAFWKVTKQHARDSIWA